MNNAKRENARWRDRYQAEAEAEAADARNEQ